MTQSKRVPQNVGPTKSGTHITAGPTLQRSAEEVEGIEWVGEVSKEHPDSYTAGAMNFLHGNMSGAPGGGLGRCP
jgi:hypothetical protein